MDSRTQIQDLSRLLQDDGVRKELAEIDDEERLVGFVADAGRKADLRFDPEWLRQFFIDVRVIRTPPKLNRDELEKFGDGGWASSSENKLCHTDSCGGRHGGCC
jgi:hypothetical protein